MKKRKYLIAIVVIVFIYFWFYKPPEFAGMTNQFKGTFACEADPACCITAYTDGTFYYYNQSLFSYKGTYTEVGEMTYDLEGKKIKPQQIKIGDHKFIFIDGEVEISFKKINEIPIIAEPVKKEAE